MKDRTSLEQPKDEIVSEEKKTEKQKKKQKIIVRNLVFDINKSHLQNLFKKYGEIIEINIPLNL